MGEEYSEWRVFARWVVLTAIVFFACGLLEWSSGDVNGGQYLFAIGIVLAVFAWGLTI